MGQQLALTCVRFSSSRQEVFGGASEGVEMPEAVQGGRDGGKPVSEVSPLALTSPSSWPTFEHEIVPWAPGVL